MNGTTQIQSYVKQLIDVTKSWNCSDVTYTTVRLEDFFADIKEQALGLVEIYHQKIDWKAEQSDKKVTIAYDPMFRAVMNVIQNAVEHTKENGIIYIDAKEQDGRLTFIVEDSGSGFTKEALLHGTEQFFMDDTSRNGEAHYGMGLFFAKTVAEKYGGGIKLSNSENTGGAIGLLLVVPENIVPEFKSLLVAYYEGRNEDEIKAFLKEKCWRKF